VITNPNGTSASSRLRVLVCLFLFIAASMAVLGAIASSRAIGQRESAFRQADGGGAANGENIKIAPWVIEHTASGQQAEFFVVLADQADLSGAAALRTKAEKGRYVHDALWNKSQASQRSILQWLRERGIEHRSFYIVNAILVKGSREMAEALASRSDVARIEGNPHIRNPLPQPDATVEAPSQPQKPETIEPGISYTHAPDVWALGFRGQGITVAGADTGQRWTHNALKPHYRGWDGQNADHNYNWHDSIHDSVGNSCGNDSPFPCDDNGHGTHTIGTAIGDDGMGNQIGMAPGARWIGCRNMDRGNGTPARYIECMEWFLAPYPIGGGQGDPLRAPDITSNSWVCPPSEGCSADTLQAAVEAQAAAGIMMVAGAGNDGPNCSTVMYPPAIYAASYTVGALNTGTDNIASFSSRGPVTIDGSNRIKPDISAPGTGTRSSYNTSDSAYAILSGTSMATPHIAGAMALLWCARPELRHNISQSRTVLDEAAFFLAYKQCGTPGPPNNVTGWGRVDILAAASPTPPPCDGIVTPVFVENFDGVTPPALPPNWVATNVQGPPPLWATSNSGVPMPPAYSPPNAAFIDDPNVVSDKRLDSPTWFPFEAYWVRLTFHHNFNFEASSEDPNLGFDGGVLEISTDNGNTYQDITAVGSFVNGGYNRTISTDRGSPIAGRQAWSGNSQGFITTTVELPFSLYLSKLRWRMASDTSGSDEGWRVDDPYIYECHFTGTPTATPTSPPPTPTATALRRRLQLRSRPLLHQQLRLRPLRRLRLRLRLLQLPLQQLLRLPRRLSLPLPPQLRLHHQLRHLHLQLLRRLHLGQRLRPGRVQRRDHDPPRRRARVRNYGHRSSEFGVGRGHRPRLQFVEIFNHFLHTADHQREPVVIELLGRVARRMVMRITERCSVSDHDARITTPPERPLV
jgi:serine protease AprX